MKVKQFKKTLRYAVGYGATQDTLNKLCRASKVKHLPARQKKRIARQVRQVYKAVSFAARYTGGRGASKPTLQAVFIDYADLSKLESMVIANLPQVPGDYLVTH